MKFKVWKKALLISVLGLSGVMSAKTASKPEAYKVFGKTVTMDEVVKNNKGAFYELENQKYKKVNDIAINAYLEAFWKKEAAAKKTTVEKARDAYFDKNIKVTQSDIDEMMKKVKDHPQLKNLSKEKKEEQIRNYLKGQQSRTVIDKLLTVARKKGDLVVSYPAPEEPRYDVALRDSDFLRYGPEPTATKPVKCKGSDCPIVVVEYTDFQCPFCARALSSTKAVLSDPKVKGKIVWAVRDFPLGFHPRAKPAGIAAKCAGTQGKYWEMYHKLFENQKKLSDADFETYAKDIGLDVNKYKACYKAPGVFATQVDENFAEGQKLGVSGTPAFFINGKRLSGALPKEEFMRVINTELKLAEASSKKKKS